MTKISETIVFFGSGPVAAESLEKLAYFYNIEAVITKPAKTRKNDPVPVIDSANKLNLKTYLPSTRSELDELLSNEPLKSKVAVLIDYGIIVSQFAIDYFPRGIINSHFSLLPKWRGADPITYSILGGDQETGVSLMILTAGMDEGPLIGQSKLTLNGTETTQTLTHQLVDLSVNLLEENLSKYLSGDLVPIAQDPTIEPTYSRKLIKSDGKIDWSKSAVQIEREIRAYSTWPRSFTTLKDLNIIITQANVIREAGEAGKYVVRNNGLVFYCGDGAIEVLCLIPSGKKEMDITAFMAGYKSKL